MTQTTNGSPARRRVLVTGASRGLGLAIAHGFAGQGAALAVNGRDGAALEAVAASLRAGDTPVVLAPGDVARDAPAIIAAARAGLGGLDVVVHAAALRDRRPTAELDADAFSALLDANLTGAYAIGRAAMPHLAASQAGRLVFVTSIAAMVARAGDPAYAAAKGGLAALTRSLAVEFGSDRLTVNAVAPGFFATETNRGLAADPAITRFIDMRVPLRRWGRPEEIAPAVLFLASAEASYVNGVTLTVDGGLSARM
ncbi:MAG: SDR family oxidoreductase [Beijerinckiaceae bacterium]|nr:SDR family oxidoreductase [Beijerinckiaceae bacterium]